jgi:Zn-dependent peptidase ImmA (M78 family)/transcriptional regulator with XRE-family HTH domain
MGARIPALVQPPLLVWARVQAGYTLEQTGERMHQPVERLAAWERGERRPTIRQAQELAKFFHMPLGVFYLPQPPAVTPLAAEYRRLPGITPGSESPELRLAIRTMSNRREVTLQLSGEVGAAVPDRLETARLSEPPQAVAGRLRKALGVTWQEQSDWANEWQAWRAWRGAVENLGVMVFQFPKVDLNQVRGISLLDFPLPVIGINSKETSAASRSFTLIHELVHIALARGREEQVALREARDDAAWQGVERFAEEVTSGVLIPEENLGDSLRELTVPQDGWDVATVRSLAGAFRVTPLAMATRLRSVGALTWAGYARWKQQWESYLAALPPRRGGFASPVHKTLSRAGRPFAQLVLEAMDGNRITAVDATRYLDLRFDHFEQLRAELRLGGKATTNAVDDGE